MGYVILAVIVGSILYACIDAWYIQPYEQMKKVRQTAEAMQMEQLERFQMEVKNLREELIKRLKKTEQITTIGTVVSKKKILEKVDLSKK